MLTFLSANLLANTLCGYFGAIKFGGGGGGWGVGVQGFRLKSRDCCQIVQGLDLSRLASMIYLLVKLTCA